MPDYRHLLVIFICMLPSLSSWASIEPLALTGINGSVIGNSTLITLDLNRAPSWQDVTVQSRGNLLELKLPDTVASDAGKFHNVNSPYVLKLLPLQLDAQTASLRVFASTEGHLLQKATMVEVAGKQIILFVDHSKLQPVLPSKTISTEAHGNSWLGKIQLAAIVLVAVLTLLLCLFGLWRFFVWKVRRTHDRVQSSVLRSVGQLPLSAQHHLALVEVYGQRLLFAVSDRSVELMNATDFNANAGDNNKPSRTAKLPMPTPPTQLDHDIYLNESNLSAQKSMQRGQHYRETLPRMTTEQQPEVAQNGVGLTNDTTTR